MKKLIGLVLFLSLNVNAQEIKISIENQEKLKTAIIETQKAVAAVEAAKTKAELENEKLKNLILTIMAELKLSPKEYNIVAGENGFTFVKIEPRKEERKLP